MGIRYGANWVSGDNERRDRVDGEGRARAGHALVNETNVRSYLLLLRIVQKLTRLWRQSCILVTRETRVDPLT